MRLLTLFVFVFCCLTVSAPAFQQQPAKPSLLSSMSITFKATHMDRYIFRGRTFDTDAVDQGELGFGIGSWSYNFLQSETGDDPFLFSQEQVHNISITTLSRRGVTTIGYQFFDYDGDLPDTQELFVRYAGRSKWNTTYGIAWDIETYKGYYFDGSVSRFLPLTRRMSALFGMTVGAAYNLDEERGRNGVVLEPGFFGKDGVSHGAANLDLVWNAKRWLRLKTGVSYHRAFDDELHGDTRVEEDETVWASTVTITLGG